MGKTIFLCMWMAVIASVQAAPPRYSEPEAGAPLQKLQSTLDGCRLQIANHDTELKMFENKLDNFETILEALNQQLEDYGKSQKELLKKNGEAVGSKVQSLESSHQKVLEDLKRLQTHANDTSTTLGQTTQKMAAIEKLLDIQNQNIEHLKSTLKLLMELIQDKNGLTADESSDKTYRIQPGDSLEKIAKAKHTTVQRLKELNGLTTDRIVVGKILKIQD